MKEIEQVISFVKLAGYWFAHIPDYEGEPEDLVMVSGADVLCDLIDNDNTGYVSIEVRSNIDDMPNKESWLKCEFIKADEFGANYKVTGRISMDIWLCNVTKYVFGEFPAEMYINKI